MNRYVSFKRMRGAESKSKSFTWKGIEESEQVGIGDRESVSRGRGLGNMGWG